MRPMWGSNLRVFSKKNCSPGGPKYYRPGTFPCKYKNCVAAVYLVLCELFQRQPSSVGVLVPGKAQGTSTNSNMFYSRVHFLGMNYHCRHGTTGSSRCFVSTTTTGRPLNEVEI
jgi:hypothetical protein